MPGIHGRIGVPGLAPLAHRLDLTGLFVPDAVRKGSHPRGADIEDVLTHPQRPGVMLDHAIDKAQVVGAACWSSAMGVVLMGPDWVGDSCLTSSGDA